MMRKLGLHPETPPTETYSSFEAERLSSSAERSRRFRERLKEDPERYKLYRKKENERITKLKQRRTEEQKAKRKENARLWMRKVRQKKKELGLPLIDARRLTGMRQQEKCQRDNVRQSPETSPAEGEANGNCGADRLSFSAESCSQFREELKVDPERPKLCQRKVNELERMTQCEQCQTGEQEGAAMESATLQVHKARQKKKELGLPLIDVRRLTGMGQKDERLKDSEKEPSQTSPVKTNGNCDVDRLSSAAKRSRRFREQVKRDPERYKQFRKKENERISKSKQRRTEEQKAAQRENAKLRMRQARQKKKELDFPTMDAKRLTAMGREEKRQRDRERKRKYRSSLSWQKKQEINQRRRAERSLKAVVLAVSSTPVQSALHDFRSYSASSGSESVKEAPQDFRSYSASSESESMKEALQDLRSYGASSESESVKEA